MNVKVKLFAVARDRCGTGDLVISVPSHATSADALETLLVLYPSLAQLKEQLRVAVNWEYVPCNHPLAEDDELAIIPPVSGG